MEKPRKGKSVRQIREAERQEHERKADPADALTMWTAKTWAGWESTRKRETYSHE